MWWIYKIAKNKYQLLKDFKSYRKNNLIIYKKPKQYIGKEYTFGTKPILHYQM